MAKQVQMNPEVNEALNRVTASRQQKSPHRHVSKQEVVADLIMRADKRETKK